MNSFNRIYTQCDICGKDIHYGNAVLEIERNVEQHDYDEETGLQTVTVIDADSLATLCASCGNSMANRKELWKLLVQELELPGPACDDDAAQATESGLPETCDSCGMELTVGRARVALVQLIGQVDWSEQRDDSELSVIDGEDILSFCPECGNGMSSRRLDLAIHKVLDDLGAPERLEAGVGTEQDEQYGSPDQSVKILHIIAKGAEIALYGWKDRDGVWQFGRESSKSDLYDEDAGAELQYSSDRAPGWHGTLDMLSRCPWYRMTPLYVHPEFTEQIMDGLLNAPEEQQPYIDYDAWQAVCNDKKL